MDISTDPGVSAATAAVQGPAGGSVQTRVLRKALDLQASEAASLIAALPPPVLATSGSVGTRINTTA